MVFILFIRLWPQDEWEELQEEEMLYHKLRKGKISYSLFFYFYYLDKRSMMSTCWRLLNSILILLSLLNSSDDEEEDSDVMEEKMNRQHQLKKNIRKMKAKKSKRFNKH